MTTPFAFVDTETTGLRPDTHMIWELAIIKRLPDGPDIETVFQIRPDLVMADEEALEIGRFHDRFKVPPGQRAAVIEGDNVLPLEVSTLRYEVDRLLRGTVLVGSNTAFDASFLFAMLRDQPWHYRVVNALELAAGSLLARGEDVPMPWSSADISRRVGVEPPGRDAAHTALADARWARDVFDAVRATNAVEDAIGPVYRERAHLLALLSKHAGQQNAALTAAPDAPGWWLLGLRVGGKVCTWHISATDLVLFSHVVRVDADDPRVHWDGHTTAEKYLWLQMLANGG